MQAGQCVSQCADGLYIAGTVCVGSCASTCGSCLVYADYCLSCVAGLYFVGNKCVISCAFMYYPTDTFECLSCAALAINCKNCLNATVCLTCDPGYIFYENTQCIDYIPSGYANISGIAIACNPACTTCLNLIDNCTACRYTNYYNGNCIPQCPLTHYSLNH